MISKVTSSLPPEWSALVDPHSPFTDARHLSALEKTGCLGDATGWYPCHITVWDQEQCIAGLPLYLKTNSYGEFIFDHMWSSALQRSGVKYYPKLVTSAPFTPATGSRLLWKPGLTEQQRKDAGELVFRELKKLQSQASSHHVLFLPEEDIQPWETEGYCRRWSFQYHWRNQGWKTFEGFLSSLVSKRRRQIALERRQLKETAGVKIEVLTGNELSPQLADFVFQMYKDTNDKMGSHVCLTRGFFEETFVTLKSETVLFYATLDGKPLAAAINYKKGGNLFGRYWGTLADVRNLHFELCYYQAIDFAIAEGFAKYEAGAQGEHKFPRGFEPQFTHSVHHIAHPEFHGAIAQFCLQEKKHLDSLFAEYSAHSPFKRESEKEIIT